MLNYHYFCSYRKLAHKSLSQLLRVSLPPTAQDACTAAAQPVNCVASESLDTIADHTCNVFGYSGTQERAGEENVGTLRFSIRTHASFPGPLLERAFLYTTFDPRGFKDHDSRIEIARGSTRVLYGANCKVLGTPLCRINLFRRLFHGDV